MTEVIIHIGHGKTGSSYLQSILALNVERLEENGIHYPDHKSLSAAAKGHITSGNGSLLTEGKVDIEKHERVLFSSEALFSDLLGSEILKKIAQKYKIKIILFSRNIFEHSFSRWAQSVKRGGLTSDLDSYLQSHPVGPHSKILEWISSSEKLGFELALRNYSVHKKDLRSIFLRDIFGCETDDLKIHNPPSLKVNRSLTSFEYDIQRVFNFVEGERSSKYISDPVVNKLPNIEENKLTIKSKTYETVLEKNFSIIRKVNEFIDPNEALVIEDRDSIVSDSHVQNSLTDEQIEVLGNAIRCRFHASLMPEDKANVCRDLALKIERNNALDLIDALELMKIAQQIRPDGPVINAKVREWAKLVHNENE